MLARAFGDFKAYNAHEEPGVEGPRHQAFCVHRFSTTIRKHVPLTLLLLLRYKFSELCVGSWKCSLSAFQEQHQPPWMTTELERHCLEDKWELEAQERKHRNAMETQRSIFCREIESLTEESDTIHDQNDDAFAVRLSLFNLAFRGVEPPLRPIRAMCMGVLDWRLVFSILPGAVVDNRASTRSVTAA